MRPFSYSALPGKVIFGSGTIERVAGEIQALGCSRALLLSTPQQLGQIQELSARIGAAAVRVFADATMHTPAEVTGRALYAVRDCGADCTVALGGGSTIGLGKAIALRTDLPQIVMPTTYAGSEATPILGETKDGREDHAATPEVLPEVIIYDADLTLTLPAGLSVTSGINAIAHAAEALYARDGNPIVSLMAEEGIRALGAAPAEHHRRSCRRDARTDALYGAWLCGVVLGAVGMSLHHKLCHTLAGPSTCPTPKPTPSCCPTPSPTTRRPRPKRWPGGEGAWRGRCRWRSVRHGRSPGGANLVAGARHARGRVGSGCRAGAFKPLLESPSA